ncbi:hypothetical protein SSX86_015286 [Deinandra increscens subsp. villosa]|uniref:PB1 domain-containing protein n=1 Tax=Deinandra increscens subsp. villosa TaxID=3103831 RepID=A0AAP0CZS7_9ASTR
MSTSGDVESTSYSSPSSRPAAGSPRTKVKFLCSYGGKILPRPADAHLKYVGGETRVISVPRNITFTGLMKKLSGLIDGDVTLKYQLIPEELDALVTVKSDEDLHHMFEEYDRHDFTGTPRLRTFLFPASPIIMDNQIGPIDRHSLEQRYINCVNGIIFNPTIHNSNFRPPAVNTNHTSFTISSTCSSPRTPPEAATPTVAAPSVIINSEIAGFRKLGAMTRARSSPNLCDLNPSSQPSQPGHKNLAPMSTLNLSLNNQQYPYYQHHHHRQPPPPPPPQPQLPHYHHPQLFPKPPLDPSPHKHSSHSGGSDHFARMRSAEYYRHPTDNNNNQHISSPYARSSRGGGGHMVYQRGSPYEEYYGNNRYDRESPPGSPLARSPLNNNYASRWDSVGGR